MVDHCGTHREDQSGWKTPEIMESNLWMITTLLTRPCAMASLSLNTSCPFQHLAAIPVKQFLLPDLNHHLRTWRLCPLVLWLPAKGNWLSLTWLLAGGGKLSVAGSAVSSSPLFCFVSVTLRPQPVNEGWQNYSKSVLRRLGITISRQSVSQSNLSFKVYRRKSATTAAIFVC